jgi:5-methylthioribose kinase
LERHFPKAAGAGEGTRRVEAAGDGNINWVRRVRAGEASFIVKQAGPALAKFPEYAVSPARLLHEERYFATAARFDPERATPTIHFVDPENHVMVLEDVGAAERLDDAWARGDDATEDLCRIARFLGRVHRGTGSQTQMLAPFPDPKRDDGVLRLHFDHIFRLPFDGTGFPLSPAVRAAADDVAADAKLRHAIAFAESSSQRPGWLIHGDVQPTNILLAPRGAVLLDAETAHSGAPCFEVGILAAHILLDCVAHGRLVDAAERVGPVWQAYLADGEPLCAFDAVATVAGVEMLRRTLGAARVPAVADDAVALEVVRVGRRLLLDPPDRPTALAVISR